MQEVAYQMADKWLQANYKVYKSTDPNHMYEKVGAPMLVDFETYIAMKLVINNSTTWSPKLRPGEEGNMASRLDLVGAMELSSIYSILMDTD